MGVGFPTQGRSGLLHRILLLVHNVWKQNEMIATWDRIHFIQIARFMAHIFGKELSSDQMPICIPAPLGQPAGIVTAYL